MDASLSSPWQNNSLRPKTCQNEFVYKIGRSWWDRSVSGESLLTKISSKSFEVSQEGGKFSATIRFRVESKILMEKAADDETWHQSFEQLWACKYKKYKYNRFLQVDSKANWFQTSK